MDKISSQQSKLIKRLALKKYRKSEESFIVEGLKMVKEALKSPEFVVQQIWSDAKYQDALMPSLEDTAISYHKENEIARCSLLNSSPGVIAKVAMPHELPKSEQGWQVVVNSVRDPGNLGTIIRIADWFGIAKVWCTKDSVDCFNPKVLQASMGSVFRVMPEYFEAGEITAKLAKASLPIYTAEMQGENFQAIDFPSEGILILGSESHGVNGSLLPEKHHKITIGRKGGAESLNVAVAFGILAARIIL